jgi:hypothetical protein
MHRVLLVPSAVHSLRGTVGAELLFPDYVTQKVRGPVDSPNAITLRSGQGTAVYERQCNRSKSPASKARWESIRLPLDVNTQFLDFEWVAWTHPSGATYERVRLPIWIFILATLLLAIAIRPQPRWRFGLLDLFTLSTVAAIVVGLLAAGLRAIS